VAIVSTSGALLGVAVYQNGSRAGGITGTDYGLDTNGNGLFDYLVVKMSYTPDQAGYYMVAAVLLGTSDPSQDCFGGLAVGGLRISGYPISVAYVQVFLEKSDNEIKLAFTGKDIYRSEIDGPFTVIGLAMPSYGIGMYPYGPGVSPGMNPGTDPVTGAGARPGVNDPYMGWTMPAPWVYITGTYSYTDFETATSAIKFTTTITDQGVDTNANGLYEYLRVISDVQVNLAGYYSFSATLMKLGNPDPSSMYGMPMLGSFAWGEFDLASGPQTVSLEFNGDEINAAGIDGPYQVTISAYYFGDYNYYINWSDTGRMDPQMPPGQIQPGIPGYPSNQVVPGFDYYYDFACHQTNAYKYTEFEERVQDIIFTGFYSDLGIDNDGNGLYEQLHVDVGVAVYKPGMYQTMATLFTSDGTTPISYSYDMQQLNDGLQSVSLNFDGGSINASGLDGPYLVNVTVMDMRGMGMPSMISTSFFTRTYTHDQFEGYSYWNGTRGVWIDSVDVSVSGDPPNMTGTASVIVTRGPDLLTVDLSDNVYLVVMDTNGNEIFRGSAYVQLPTGGMSASASFSFTLPEHGEYTATAYLTSVDRPTSAMQVSFTA